MTECHYSFVRLWEITYEQGFGSCVSHAIDFSQGWSVKILIERKGYRLEKTNTKYYF